MGKKSRAPSTLHRELREALHRALDNATVLPRDGMGGVLRGELQRLLEGLDALTPEMVRHYALAVTLMLDGLKNKSLRIDAGDLAVLAKGGAALDVVWKAHPNWSADQVIQYLRDTGQIVSVAEPSPNSTRGPAGRA
jgi:hypothetical protein